MGRSTLNDHVLLPAAGWRKQHREVRFSALNCRARGSRPTSAHQSQTILARTGAEPGNPLASGFVAGFSVLLGFMRRPRRGKRGPGSRSVMTVAGPRFEPAAEHSVQRRPSSRSRPSPKCLQDSGRIGSLQENLGAPGSRAELARIQTVRPKVARHQQVAESRYIGFESRRPRQLQQSVKEGLPVSGGSLLANRPEAAEGFVCKRFASGAGLIEIPHRFVSDPSCVRRRG
jgi:hypothetical protein